LAWILGFISRKRT